MPVSRNEVSLIGEPTAYKYFSRERHSYYFFFLLSMEKRSTKSRLFSHIVKKKHHSTLKMDTFKGMLLPSYLASLNNKPRTCL